MKSAFYQTLKMDDSCSFPLETELSPTLHNFTESLLPCQPFFLTHWIIDLEAKKRFRLFSAHVILVSNNLSETHTFEIRVILTNSVKAK